VAVRKLKYIVTTTRRSNPRTRSLAKELALSLPHALKINRGKARLDELVEYAKGLGAANLVIVGRGLQGNPGRIEIVNFCSSEETLYRLILKLRGVRLAREYGARPRPPPEIAIVAQAQPPSLELGHELAATLNLPLLETDDPSAVKGVYSSIILVEPLTGGLLAVKFVSPEGEPKGPRLLVEKYAIGGWPRCSKRG